MPDPNQRLSVKMVEEQQKTTLTVVKLQLGYDFGACACLPHQFNKARKLPSEDDRQYTMDSVDFSSVGSARNSGYARALTQ